MEDIWLSFCLEDGSNEMLASIYQNIWHHIAEDSNLYSHCHVNLKSIIEMSSVFTKCLRVYLFNLKQMFVQ
jgi:hypothetical protein